MKGNFYQPLTYFISVTSIFNWFSEGDSLTLGFDSLNFQTTTIMIAIATTDPIITPTIKPILILASLFSYGLAYTESP